MNLRRMLMVAILMVTAAIGSWFFLRSRLRTIELAMSRPVVTQYVGIPGEHLEASWKTLPGGIGIPGLTKVYEAELTNRGTVAVQVRVCDFVTDAMMPGQNVAYTIQRWDEKTASWHNLWRADFDGSCRPTPLSMVRAQLRDRWLRPGQTVATGFIAIQALDEIRLHDRLRFAIAPFADGSSQIVTDAFVIDERPTDTSTQFRTKH